MKSLTIVTASELINLINIFLNKLDWDYSNHRFKVKLENMNDGNNIFIILFYNLFVLKETKTSRCFVYIKYEGLSYSSYQY